jgi:hypothetical protein
MNYNQCEELISSYDNLIQEKIIKETFHLGSFDDANSVRVIMGLKPKELTCDTEGKIYTVEFRNKNSQNEIEAEAEIEI